MEWSWKLTQSDAFKSSQPFGRTSEFDKSRFLQETIEFRPTTGFDQTSRLSSSDEFTASSDVNVSGGWDNSEELWPSKQVQSNAIDESELLAVTHAIQGSGNFVQSSFSQSGNFAVTRILKSTWRFGQTIQEQTEFFRQSNSGAASKGFARSADLGTSQGFGLTNFFDQSQQPLPSIEQEAALSIQETIVFSTSLSFCLTKFFMLTNQASVSAIVNESDDHIQTFEIIPTNHLVRTDIRDSCVISHSPSFIQITEFARSDGLQSSQEIEMSATFIASKSLVKSAALVGDSIEVDASCDAISSHEMNLSAIVHVSNRADITDSFISSKTVQSSVLAVSLVFSKSHLLAVSATKFDATPLLRLSDQFTRSRSFSFIQSRTIRSEIFCCSDAARSSAIGASATFVHLNVFTAAESTKSNQEEDAEMTSVGVSVIASLAAAGVLVGLIIVILVLVKRRTRKNGSEDGTQYEVEAQEIDLDPEAKTTLDQPSFHTEIHPDESDHLFKSEFEEIF
jgi:hypothetical protein